MTVQHRQSGTAYSRVESTLWQVRGLLYGGAPLETVDVKGDMDLAKRFITLFPLPPKVA